MTELKFCTFSLASVLFGVNVDCVQEIVRHQGLTPVPLAPRAVSGLINLRGQIVPAIDLRYCLGFAPRREDEAATSVVVQTEDGPVSLLVDEIQDVLDVDPTTFEVPPEHLRGNPRALLHGVFKLPTGLLVVLRVDAVIASVTGSPLAPVRDLERDIA